MSARVTSAGAKRPYGRPRNTLADVAFGAVIGLALWFLAGAAVIVLGLLWGNG